VRRGGFEGSILAFGHERENMVLHIFSFESEAKQSRPECVLPALGNNCKRVLAQQRYAKSHRILANCRGGLYEKESDSMGKVVKTWVLHSSKPL
jgi:hypothetical protein